MFSNDERVRMVAALRTDLNRFRCELSQLAEEDGQISDDLEHALDLLADTQPFLNKAIEILNRRLRPAQA